ncbi:MAG TPA: single-stranded-DNA-specific exonuclease RecJ [Verrucomicrobiae bacterium]|jgi:single-stranded-DNA-specific exonuclease
MKYRWCVAPAQPALTSFLAGELRISQLFAQCLVNRGLSEPGPITRFLQPRLKDLADPFLIPNMRAAVERLFAARAQGESLVVFGDYDVDGVTASALLTDVLRKLGWQVQYYLPHRLEEGYGLSRSGVENCLQKFPTKLLLAVDCGSTAFETIQWLRQSGIDTIVLDHHQLEEHIPPAVALVNPHHSSSKTGHARELCSAGLAFKLAHALLKHGRETGLSEALEFDLRPYLDLVALGTIADLASLVGENRILITAGLERLNRTTRPGLIALREVAQIKQRITGYEVGFLLAPRLNAAGRLENALEALHLLMAEDLSEAMPMALRLDAQNRERQEIERSIAKDVIASLRSRFDSERDYVIIEGDPSWHLGVVGIVASRVLQEFYRPAIIFGGDGEHWRGSCRSIEGFDIAAALRECTELLVKHGGHAMAAGVSMIPENLEALRTRLNTIARRYLRPEHLQPPLRLDAEIIAADLSAERVDELNQIQQTGIGNPALQFCIRNVTHQRPLQRVGADKKHVKMWVTDGTATREAVWWGAGTAENSLPSGRFDLAFTPQLNEFNGTTTVQLKVLDWRPV